LGLNENEISENFPVDWRVFPDVVLSKVQEFFSSGVVVLEETRVYLSCDPRSNKDKKLKNWAYNWLEQQAGFKVIFKERKPKGSPVCPICHNGVEICPSCGSPLKRTVEKGIDTSIATDMIKLAWEDSYDVGVLVASDADYVPVAQFLDTKGKKVIAALFPPLGKSLISACWASIDLNILKEKFYRKKEGQ